MFANGKEVKANYKVNTGDILRFEEPELKEPDILAEYIPLDILYEDSDLLIVNKPKGMVVHPSAGHYSGTLVNALMHYCKDDLSGINGVLRPGIVHRIDMDTTGSLLVCKNDFTHNDIAEQLNKIQNIYLDTTKILENVSFIFDFIRFHYPLVEIMLRHRRFRAMEEYVWCLVLHLTSPVF